MKNNYKSIILKTSLAIFAMLFGSANLIFPIKIGILSGSKVSLGILGFILSGILIPISGLISMVYFKGDYHKFFYRIGKIPGNILIFLSMLIIGPLIAMPRIITFSYEIAKPFMPTNITLLIFSIIFSMVTFLFSYKKNSVIDIIGNLLSPLLLIFLGIIFILGYLQKETLININLTNWQVLHDSFLLGYNTLDLLATIFFAYIVFSILHNIYINKNINNKEEINYVFKVTFWSSLVAGFLLSIVYSAIAYLGAWHGHSYYNLDAGKMFINTVLKILGSKGTLLISFTVFLACLTTIIALASVVSEYIKNEILKNKISYLNSLILILSITIFMSQIELGPLLTYSAPIIYIIYPVLITLTFCNLAYSLFGFKPVKVPVLIVFIINIFYHGPEFLEIIKKIFTI